MEYKVLASYGRLCIHYFAVVFILFPTVHRETVRLLYTKYASVVSEHNIIRVTGVARVSGQEKSILEMVNIPLSKPKLSIKVGFLSMSKMLSLVLCDIS